MCLQIPYIRYIRLFLYSNANAVPPTPTPTSSFYTVLYGLLADEHGTIEKVNYLGYDYYDILNRSLSFLLEHSEGRQESDDSGGKLLTTLRADGDLRRPHMSTSRTLIQRHLL